MNRNFGFTLIEMMIVVAIVGVLAAISIPLYQGYVAKSQITTALAELNGAKTQYELILSGATASASVDFTVLNMFFNGSQSNVCIYDVNPPVSGVANKALVCQLNHVATPISGEFVYLNRDLAGAWTCSTSPGVATKFKPSSCS